MPARPLNEVTWDTNDTDTTAPTSGEQTDGLPIASTLSRQKINWIFARLSQWVRYHWQSIFRPADVYADQISRAHSDPPGTGAGLGPVAAADFSARVFINGMAVGPVASSSYTYSASSDTYWDLDEDGLWTAAAVANGAGAPALTANSVRCFMVVTDGTDRTAVTDYTPAHVTVDQPLRLQGVTYRQEAATDVYELIEQDQDSSGADLPTRTYRSDTGPTGYAQACRVIAVNAVWDESGSVWNRDVSGDSYLYIFGRLGSMTLTRNSGLSSGWLNTLDDTTGWHTDSFLSEGVGYSFIKTSGTILSGGSITSLSTCTATNLLYSSRLTRTRSINGSAGACNNTGSTATGYDLFSFGQGIQTATTAAVSYPLDVHVPNGAILTSITWQGSAGSAGNTRVSVGRVDKTTGTISYFRSGTTYDTFTNQAYLTAMPLTLDAAFAATAFDHAAYSYFVYIAPQAGQDDTSVLSIDVVYTVAGPD